VLEGLRSLPLESKDAEKIVDILRGKGLLLSAVIAGGAGAELFEDYVRRFWTYDKSPYVTDKHAHEQRMGKTHCFESLGRAEKYWIPYFKGKHLAEVTRADIKAFSLSLAAPELKIKPITRNRILTVGTTALRWAYENDLIAEDPTAGVSSYSAQVKRRGVLTPEEATALFKLEWPDERVKLGNLVAMTTGLRQAEIIALKREDIAEAWLDVRHSYSRRDKLKTTKTATGRRVPLLPEIRKALLGLAEKSPYGPDGFIFWGDSVDEPMKQGLLLDGLQDALLHLSLGNKYVTASDEAKAKAIDGWKTRNIVFHSWRHFYAARMADKLEARKIMLATGHKTESVFDAYADHALDSDLAEVGRVAGEVFENIIPFTKAATA